MFYLKKAFDLKPDELRFVVHPNELSSYCRKLKIFLSIELISSMSVLVVPNLSRSDSVLDNLGNIRIDVPFTLRVQLRLKSKPAKLKGGSGRYKAREPKQIKSVYDSLKPLSASIVEYSKKTEKTSVDFASIEQVLKNPELDSIKPVNIDPASMLVDDIETLSTEGREFIDNPTLAGVASMAAIAIPGKFVDGAAEQIIKKSFVGKYKGIDITLDNVNVSNIKYIKRDREEYLKLRKSFDSSVRKKYLKGLSQDRQAITALTSLGVNENELKKLAAGKVPKGFQVHHKLPLDDGGTNDFDNLVLIRTSPEHSVLTTYQKQTTSSLNSGDSSIVEWPSPQGNVFPYEK